MDAYFRQNLLTPAHVRLQRVQHGHLYVLQHPINLFLGGLRGRIGKRDGPVGEYLCADVVLFDLDSDLELFVVGRAAGSAHHAQDQCPDILLVCYSDGAHDVGQT